MWFSVCGEAALDGQADVDDEARARAANGLLSGRHTVMRRVSHRPTVQWRVTHARYLLDKEGRAF
jgi:hypothetical protein